ncbi:MAG TPA: hypothetical protein VNP36_01675 [Burkholderiales bacterium]|nr:hypothetical protein [Burkholderiales bacterium]
MFTAVVRITGAGRLDDFRERLRWLMVRDEDAEDYTEHHAAGVLEYRFSPRRGIPFPAFTAASAEFPELRVEAQWERDGERGRAVLENGQLVEQTAAQAGEAPVDVKVGEEGRLELGLTCRAQPDGALIGYAVTDARHTYFRYRDGALTLLSPEEPDAAIEEVAFRFVDEWIWYDEEEAALERVRYANYGYPVRGANLKSEKLALLRAQGGAYSSIDENAKAARAAIVAQWLKQ